MPPKREMRKQQEPTVPVRIIAADPSVGRDGPLTAVVDIPFERLGDGPRGYRVHVVDYDTSSGTLYSPAKLGDPETWKKPLRAADLGSPDFHARNVYALGMRTLARFEFALGRRIKWGFEDGHQLKIAPHAFCDGNAFYSRADEALMFGYFPKLNDPGHVFTCLSHDVVVHETSHALLDGLRERFIDPSSADQAAFHEAFSDVVALLSVFSLKELVMYAVDISGRERPSQPHVPPDCIGKAGTTYDALRKSTLFAIGRELGSEMSPIGRSALRNSVAELKPSPQHLRDRTSSHDRGEVLVAAVIDAFIRVWAQRLEPYFVDSATRFVGRERLAEEGAQAADYLLTMVVRSLDYLPPVHVQFGTFLSAMITADRQMRPNDPFLFREHLVKSFGLYGIKPDGTHKHGWAPFQDPERLNLDLVRFESMQRDRDEMFRFVWENRKELQLYEQAYSRVISLRPCVRIGPTDGFVLKETVAEVLQQVKLKAGELGTFGMTKPKGMPDSTDVTLTGGVTLIFDEFGRLRFRLGSSVLDEQAPGPIEAAHGARLEQLWIRGAFRKGLALRRHFGAMHRLRAAGHPRKEEEGFA